jgi:predicted MFS family arabinose efflux permease
MKPVEPTDHRWLLWGLATAMLALQNLEVLTVGSLSGNLGNSLQISPSQVGGLFGIYTLCYALTQIPVGLAFARYSPTKLLTLACIVFAAGNFIFATSNTLSIAYIGRMLAGVGGGFFFLGYFAITASRFDPLQFATLLGVSQLAKFLLAMGVLAMMPVFLDSGGNWRVYFNIVGAVFLLFIPVLVLTGRARPGKDPGDVNSSKTSIWDDLKTVCKNPQIIRTSIIGFLGAGGVMAFGGLWYLPFAESSGFPPLQADRLDSVLMLFMGLGTTAAGWISDRLRRRKTIIVVGLTISLIVTLALILIVKPPLWIETGLVAILAVASASFIAMLYVMIKESVPARLATTAGGVVNTTIYAGLALQQYLPGWILSLESGPARGIAHTPIIDYQWALIIYPPGILISLLAALKLRETARQ